MFISSKDNPRIKAYCKLSTSKKAREEQGSFVIEGMINCVDIIGLSEQMKNIEITSLFYTEDAVEKHRDDLSVELLEGFDESRRYVITPEVAAKMSQVEQASGAFAVAKRLDIPFSSEALDKDGKYLVLDNIQDPGNLGTMIRTSAAVGIDGIILSCNTVDLYNPKVVRSAMASM
ncbi:MAG: RNA methyltransferase, partial [Ruminococcus sp.]|nr:RNA methyltransferase [Ruminococcus sp.]